MSRGPGLSGALEAVGRDFERCATVLSVGLVYALPVTVIFGAVSGGGLLLGFGDAALVTWCLWGLGAAFVTVLSSLGLRGACLWAARHLVR